MLGVVKIYLYIVLEENLTGKNHPGKPRFRKCRGNKRCGSVTRRSRLENTSTG